MRAKWIVPGAALLCIALLVSNTEIERTLGRAPGSLTWGPTLFRILLAVHGTALIAGAFARRRRRQVPATVQPRWPWLVLAILSLIGLGLRVFRLDSCLWLDEVLTMVDYARPPVSEIVTSFPSQNQHMLYSLLGHVSMRLFGESAWALRLPSVLFGIGSLWALFLLGRRLIGAREALLACALMTVSYHHIWFSQNARGYMGLLFFATLATWLWLEALDAKDWGRWIVYSIASALGIWMHLTMVFVIAAHVLVTGALLPRSRRHFWPAVTACLLCGTLALQVHALALPEFFRTALHETSMQSEWTKPFWAIAESLRSLRVGFSGLAVVACGAALVGMGWFGILRRDARAAIAMVLPALMGGAAMVALSHNLWPRFFFFCMGFALLIVVHGAMLVPRLVMPPRKAAVAGLALAGLIIAASALTVPRCYALPKQDFTGARDFAERETAPGEPVATIGLAAQAYRRYYAPHWALAEDASALESLRRQYPNLALVYTLPIQLRAFQPALWNRVEKDFQIVRVFRGTLGGGEIYVCRALPAVSSRTGKVSSE